jgi:hypothetical protein
MRTMCYEAFRQVIREVQVKHGISRDDLKETMRGIWDGLVRTHWPLTLDTLDNVLPGSRVRQDRDLVERRFFIYLRPPKRQATFLPLLTFRYDFSSDPLECHLYLGLYMSTNDGNTGISPGLRAIGFRFELPEGRGKGSHDYAHVQLASSFSTKSQAATIVLPEAGWLPDKQPAIPICANTESPACLVLALVASLYGPDEAAKILGEIRGRGTPGLPEHLCYLAPDQ